MNQGQIRNPFEVLFKNKIRMQIFFLLFFYNELNVSDIALKLHRSKATVSRHLIAMEEEGILDSRISQYKRSITPRYYHIPIPKFSELLPFESRAIRNLPTNPQDRLAYYKRSINAIRSSLTLTQEGLNLLNPLLDSLESQLTDIHSADRIFYEYFRSENEKKMDMQTIVISENNLPEYFELWMKFRKDVETLEKKKRGEHSYMVFETVLPFQKLVEFEQKSLKSKF